MKPDAIVGGKRFPDAHHFFDRKSAFAKGSAVCRPSLERVPQIIAAASPRYELNFSGCARRPDLSEVWQR